MTNEQLCALAQQGSADAQNELIEKNLGFINEIASICSTATVSRTVMSIR